MSRSRRPNKLHRRTSRCGSPRSTTCSFCNPGLTLPGARAGLVAQDMAEQLDTLFLDGTNGIQREVESLAFERAAGASR